MGWNPNALKRPIPSSNYGWDGRVKIGLSYHHADGSIASAEGEFMRVGSQKSSHYGIDYNGELRQWVDDAYVAYTQCAGNWQGWVTVECASDPNQPNAGPTPEQIKTLGELVVYYKFPAHQVESPYQSGVGFHRLFPGPCEEYWGQTDCPGDGFVAAMGSICNAATGGGASDTPQPYEEEDDEMRVVALFGPTTQDYLWVDDAGKLQWRHTDAAGVTHPPTVVTVNANAEKPEITVKNTIYGPILFFLGPQDQTVRAYLAGWAFKAEYV